MLSSRIAESEEYQLRFAEEIRKRTGSSLVSCSNLFPSHSNLNESFATPFWLAIAVYRAQVSLARRVFVRPEREQRRQGETNVDFGKGRRGLALDLDVCVRMRQSATRARGEERALLPRFKGRTFCPVREPDGEIDLCPRYSSAAPSANIREASEGSPSFPRIHRLLLPFLWWCRVARGALRIREETRDVRRGVARRERRGGTRE